MSSSGASNHRFTIGWISPLPLEQEAARLVFDKVYPREEVQHRNAYYLGGRIGQHDVVIGVQRKIGLNGAAILAEKMHSGFPNIKYFLVVGIAGGVPNYGPPGDTKQIVLGDVVISSPRGNHGGVIQYDKGAWHDEGILQFRGFTNGVPGDLLAAVNNYRSQGWSQTNIAQTLKQMRSRLDEDRRSQYDDPGETQDRLFRRDYKHRGEYDVDCLECCDTDRALSRSERGDRAWRDRDRPELHFGNVASSNQLQISAAERTRIQRQHDVICFEMEAAGVSEEHPCVVVRGICDYADSHKNKGWQNYAAAVAAACAKQLLTFLPPVIPNNDDRSLGTGSRAEVPTRQTRVRSQGPVPPSISCPKCPRKFDNPTKLEQHRRDAHRSRFGNDCHSCGRSFETRDARDQHNTIKHAKAKK